MLLVAVILAVVAGVTTYAVADSPEPGPVAQLEAHPGGEAFLQGAGVNASDATPAFSLQNGETVSVASSGANRCVVHTLGGKATGRCYPIAAVAQGEDITVFDECGSSGKHLMEISGLAPAGTVTVRLVESDGTSQTTSVAAGAFRFEGTNPVAGGPYPTAAEWVASDGSGSGRAPLPVSGGRFCV